MGWIRRIALFLGVMLLPIGAASITAGAATPAALRAGGLDPTFGTAGTVTTDFGGLGMGGSASATAIQPDGKIVAAGQFGSDNDFIAFALARYNTDGSLDSSFGAGGTVTTVIGGASALAIQPDGKIIVVGRSRALLDGSRRFAIARYNADGSLDSSFGGGGVIVPAIGQGGGANAVAIQPDGKIVAAGNSGDNFAVMRIDTDGGVDPTFGAGGIATTDLSSPSERSSSEVRAIAIQPDGKIVAVGDDKIDPANTNATVVAVARYNANGTLDSSFGNVGGGGGVVLKPVTGVDVTTSVALQADGKIVTAGGGSFGAGFPTPHQFVLTRWDVDGNLDEHFGQDGVVTTSLGPGSVANGLAIRSDGKILAVGVSGGDGGVLVRYTPDGSLDGSFGNGGTVIGQTPRLDPVDVAVQADGKIVIIGDVNIALHHGAFAVARFLAEA